LPSLPHQAGRFPGDEENSTLMDRRFSLSHCQVWPSVAKFGRVATCSRGAAEGCFGQYQPFRRGEGALAAAAEVGGVALAIDARDERAARSHERFGALALLGDPRKLILPLAVIAEAIAAAERRRK
jgi:hypothetical protein